MQIVIESARSLVEYIKSLDELSLNQQRRYSGYTHIGALFTDIILQAGLNYKSVVKPRVERVMIDFPQANNVDNLELAIEKYGLEKILNWKHPVKLERFSDLVRFCSERNINSCDDLTDFLSYRDNRILFLSVKGLGPKTLDYTMKLLNFDTIAVDRHIIGFMESAGLPHINYDYTKKIVEFAADLLNVSRSSLDETIWYYMSSKNIVSTDTRQLEMQFL
ncbi:HhH-GDP family DNA glycosylase [Aquimarina megaterium]|uniref:hypothetical protein n=1 Tax=Aquimarina megaterium TaxID=1443666 RepID=UPI0004718CDD|nr:hypothetical protein [Aquimarina megaterium]